MEIWKHALLGSLIVMLSALVSMGAKSYVDLKHEQAISKISLLLGKVEYINKSTDEIKADVRRIWQKLNR